MRGVARGSPAKKVLPPPFDCGYARVQYFASGRSWEFTSASVSVGLKCQ